jgi:hypothetical protein
MPPTPTRSLGGVEESARTTDEKATTALISLMLELPLPIVQSLGSVAKGLPNEG